MKPFFRHILLLLLLTMSACGNYSLLERIGPDPDNSYFCFTPGRYWVYKGTFQELHQDPVTVYVTNIVAESLYFTNSPHYVITNSTKPDIGFTAMKPETFGYSTVVNFLALIDDTWSSSASPEMVTLPYLDMPFIEGRTTDTTVIQIITNFPLSASSIPAVVRVTYDVHFEILRNNLTMEVEGTEYSKCVKLAHIHTVTITSFGDNDPYKDGDTIQSTEDDYIFHLAPGIGPIRIDNFHRELSQNNIYSEEYFSGGIVATGTLP